MGIVDVLGIAAVVLLGLAVVAAGAYIAHRTSGSLYPARGILAQPVALRRKLLRWSLESLVTLPIALATEIVLGFPKIFIALSVALIVISIAGVVYLIIVSKRVSDTHWRLR